MSICARTAGSIRSIDRRGCESVEDTRKLSRTVCVRTIFGRGTLVHQHLVAKAWLLLSFLRMPVNFVTLLVRDGFDAEY